MLIPNPGQSYMKSDPDLCSRETSYRRIFDNNDVCQLVDALSQTWHMDNIYIINLILFSCAYKISLRLKCCEIFWVKCAMGVWEWAHMILRLLSY